MDSALERLERAARDAFAKPADLHEKIHAAQLRRLTARGSSGQALI